MREPPKFACYLCDKVGHAVINCPKLKDAKDVIQPKANLVYENNTIIDSGASQHMFGTKNLFSGDMRPFKSTVVCANAERLESTHIGQVQISLSDESVTMLQDALYIPKLNRNLLSV
jgi:hypothetical protein